MKKPVIILVCIVVIVLIIAIAFAVKQSSSKAEQTEKPQEQSSSADISWSLENESEVISDVSYEKIINEIDRLDRQEIQHLILTPSSSINNCNFVQVINDITIGNAQNGDEKFHIEISISSADGNFTIYCKDNLTKDDVCDVFIKYFENGNVPDYSDWYELEFY